MEGEEQFKEEIRKDIAEIKLHVGNHLTDIQKIRGLLINEDKPEEGLFIKVALIADRVAHNHKLIWLILTGLIALVWKAFI